MHGENLKMNCIEFNSRNLGSPSLTLRLIVQLHTKLLVTVRGTSADCNWSTRRLLLRRSHSLLAR